MNQEKTNYSHSINVQFPVQGDKLPADHGYLLYAAISQFKSDLHETGWLGLELISGMPAGNGLIVLPRRAWLNLRIPADHFSTVISLAGKRLEIGGFSIRLGSPTAQLLQPSAKLYSRIVTIRGFMEAPEFLEAANRQLAKMEIIAKLEFPPEDRSRSRRIITVKDKKIVGFSLVAQGLSDEDSILLQTTGIGGRRAFGCGVFSPPIRNSK